MSAAGRIGDGAPGASDPPAPVTMTAYSDYLCPWCYVAAVRLEDVEAAHGRDVDLGWRSFLLRPEPAPRTEEQFRRYTESWRRPGAVEPRTGLAPWSSDAAAPTHSVPPAVAAKTAAAFGDDAFRRYHRALLRAYFVQHRTVSDRQVLVDVAADSGIDPEAFDAELGERGNELAGRVLAEHADALDRGIFAVPTVVVGTGPEAAVLTGAVDVEAYERAIEAARTGRASRHGDRDR